MSPEIINRVAKSPLVTIDLEDFYPDGPRTLLDIKDWLFEGFVLRETDFRERAKTHDWSRYSGHYVALTCTSDAVIPGWAFMLLATCLQPFAKKTVVGDLQTLELILFQEIINDFDVEQHRNKPLIIKGCGQKPIPENAYLQLTQKLMPVAKSIMYGEACSAVPLFKKPKQ